MKIGVLFLIVCLGFSLKPSAQKETIPNCSLIEGDFLFMSKEEVSNFSYLEYLSYHKSQLETAAYEKLLPDTTVWRAKNMYNEPYVEYYFRHPAYRDYPVVGLTKNQAELYCSWLTLVLNKNYTSDPKSEIDSVLVRLPTQSEWTFAAKGGNEYYEYPWKGHSVRVEEGKSKGDTRANFVQGKGDYMGIAGSLNDNADITAPVKAYWPNDFGLYNCAGNVAEMVADKEVAMGGCWRSSGYDIKVTSSIPFTEPASYIGFRYIVEIKKKRTQGKISPFEVNKSFLKQNFTQYKDSIWIQRFEVSNQLYGSFLKDMGKFPDTTVWNDLFPYSDQYTNNYAWHPDYSNYPAVGMTLEDVHSFCDWLSLQLKSVYGKEYEVRLPTEAEWQEAAYGGLDLVLYPWGGPYLRNAKGEALANYKYILESYRSRNQNGEWIVIYPEDKSPYFGADFDGYLATAPVDAYAPNGHGAHNFAGNVREMVQEPNITKGGSWQSEDYFLQISSREEWNEQADASVGFRVVLIEK